MTTIKLHWAHHCKAKDIGSDSGDFLGKNRGIYAWLYRNEASCRVAYVGKAVSSNFKRRYAEHFRNFFGGGYSAYRIPPTVDFLDFLIETVIFKKLGDETLLALEHVCSYQTMDSPNFFRDQYFEGSKKRAKILDDYLDHMEFAFATLPSTTDLKSDARLAEAAIGKGVHEQYLKRIPAAKRELRMFPSGNGMDTFVGRHSLPAKDTPVDLEQTFEASLKSVLPAELLSVKRFPSTII